jgi:hypothetical protein
MSNNSRSQNRGRINLIVSVMISTDIIFIQKPVLAISGIRIYPELNTIALGGVATGNMNAQLAARQADIINV